MQCCKGSKSIKVNTKSGRDVLVVGDFNLPLFQQTDGCGHSTSATVIPMFFKRYRDHQVPSLLNLVLVSNHESFLNTAPLPSVVDVIISP